MWKQTVIIIKTDCYCLVCHLVTFTATAQSAVAGSSVEQSIVTTGTAIEKPV